MEGFVRSLLSYGKAIQLIVRFRLFRYLLIPGLISLILGVFVFWSVWQFSGNVGTWISSWYDGRGESVLDVASTILSAAVVLVASFFLFKYIVLLVLSPFLSVLSARVEAKLRPTTKTNSFSAGQLVRDLQRGLRLSLRFVIRELLLTVIILAVAVLLPVLSPLTAALLFLVQSYFAGAGNLDFAMERHFSYSESLSFIRQHRGTALGNGVVFIALFLTGIGFLIAPTLATIAGTVEVVRLTEVKKV
jgi:CysZ protein